MNNIRAVTSEDLPEEDRAALIECLKLWKAEGNPNPLIPCEFDVDGDGTTDAYGLDAFGNLVYVAGTTIDQTVFEATGEGNDG